MTTKPKALAGGEKEDTQRGCGVEKNQVVVSLFSLMVRDGRFPPND